jgi:hypothetical protein
MNKRILLFAAIAIAAVAVFAIAGSPYMELDFASAYYGADGSDDSGDMVDMNDPSVGKAKAATVAETDNSVRFVLGACLGYDQPNGTSVITTLKPGDQFPVNGYTEDRTWVRLTISTQSVWVPADCGNLTR